jgi:hypothetical protein
MDWSALLAELIRRLDVFLFRRFHMNQITTHFGKVRLSFLMNPMSVSRDMSFVSQRTVYINQLTRSVVMQLRSGWQMEIPVAGPHTRTGVGGGNKEFIVRMEYCVVRAMFNQAYAFFDRVSDNDFGEVVALRDAFMKRYHEGNNSSNQEIKFIVEHFFTEEDLEENGGAFYHNALDTLFTFPDATAKGSHPFSRAGIEEEMMERSKAVAPDKQFVFSVEIIDSLGKYGDRYISISNRIFKLTAQKDKNKPDGVYIVSSTPAIGTISSENLVVCRYDFEDAEKAVGVYRTFEEAQTYGDPSLARKKEITDLEHGIQLAKHQAELAKSSQSMAKLEAERTLMERDLKIKELQYERDIRQREMDDLRARQEHLIEINRMEMKERYEQRTYVRKDTSEMLKYLPVVLTGIGAVLMAVKAFKK